MFVQLLLDRAPQAGVVDLAGPRPPEAVGREPLRAVGAVPAGRPDVRPDLAADGGRAPAQLRGYGSDGLAGAQAVGDGDSLILRQIAAVYLLRFFHVSTIPVDERALVAAGRPAAPVPPNLAGPLRDAHRFGGLSEVHV